MLQCAPRIVQHSHACAAAEAAKGLTEVQLAETHKALSARGAELDNRKAEVASAEAALAAMLAESAVTNATATAGQQAVTAELKAVQQLCKERAAELQMLQAKESTLTAELETRSKAEYVFRPVCALEIVCAARNT